MPNRPQNYLNWTDGSPTKIVEPPSNFSLQGWQGGQAPPFQYMNYLFYLTDLWIKYLDPLVSEGIPDQAMRLMNGGNWSFNATTGVLAWSSAFNIVIPSVPDSANQVNTGSVTLPDGYLAYVDLNSPIIVTGDTQSFSPIIQNVSFTNQLTSGMNVTGPGIPNGATVLSVTPTTVTLDMNATATAIGVTLVFSAAGPLTAQVAQSSSFVPAFNQILFARRSGAVVYVGVNASQMLMRDKEFKPLLGSGYFTVYEAPAGQNLTAGQVVYISQGGIADSGRTAGSLYPLDVSAANQMARGIFAGMVISNVLSGATSEILYNGFYALTSLTAGKTYYADPAVPGGIIATQPSGAGQKIVPVGFAVTTIDFLVSGTPAPSGSFTTPVFNDAILGYGNAVITDFLLPSEPLSAQALFVYLNGRIIPSSEWSLVTIGPDFYVRFNSAAAVAQQVFVEYVLAQQGYIAANQEKAVPATVMSTLVWTVVGTPISKSATRVYLDGLVIPSTNWTLTEGAQNYITFTVDPPTPDRNVYVAYFQPASSASGVLTTIANEGSGAAVFDTISGTTAILRSIKGGTGITSVADGLGNIVVSVIAGGSGVEVHGSFASPITITAAGGITPTASMDQVWWVQSIGGAVTLTANPQIAAGTSVGQRLKLKGVSATNYIVINDGTGVSQNGPCSLNNNQAIEYSWDGVAWSEDSRRV